MNRFYYVANKNSTLQNKDNVEENSSALYCIQVTLNRRRLQCF